MQTIIRSSFTTVKTEGGLLPADLLQRVADGSDLRGLRPADYHLYEGERLNEAVNRAWNRCTGAWKGFKEQCEKLPASDSGTTLTRERWLLVLFQELGFGRLPSLRSGITLGDTSFPISHLWQTTPIHLVTFRQDLDRRSDAGTGLKKSPHSLMQELLNRSPEHQWGMISNGLRLRILRDNASLRRAAFVEFDLAAMMNYELYADFVLLWMICHQSRFEPIVETGQPTAQKPARPVKHEDDEEEGEGAEEGADQTAQTCWLEIWSKTAAERGTRALDALRDGVKEAIEALGSGFLAHPENDALRDRLRNGTLSPSDYYHQLRRLVYRLIFLAVAEDRDLLLVPETTADARQLYFAHYSLRHLRDLSITVRGGPHPDLHRQLRLLFVLLREGYPELGLPGLGSFLFSSRSTPDLDSLDLANQHLLTGLRALSFAVEGSVRRPVDYRNLGSEELGSIYESLLELHPVINLVESTFRLIQGAGSERKTTGSHYTPTGLVESLLDTALEPVVADRLTNAEGQWRRYREPTLEMLREIQEKALLSIKVLDGASGSGHMLIGGGRRLALHLARVRTGDDEPPPEAQRRAMRDVVRHCLYGVDVNDMAVELCKVALWMESMEPGKPLSFLDAHIQCGNSLIGVTPGLDIREIPDIAFQPVTQDDKATAAGLRKRNKKEREGQIAFAFGDTEASGSSERHAGKRAHMVTVIEDLAEDAVEQVALKERSYAAYLQSTEYKWARWEADTWTSAFFWPIPVGDAWQMTAPTQDILRAVRAGKLKQHEDLLREVRRIARQHQFFHWELQFPEVFNRERSGFDVELMNPPWDQIQIDAREYFATSAPEIAGASSMAAREKMLQQLSIDSPSLYNAYLKASSDIDKLKHYVHDCGRFPLSSYGRLSVASLFVELAGQVVCSNGNTGLVVPTSIATDTFNQYLFRHLVSSQALQSLYSFENEEFIFTAVHNAMKFCLLTFGGSERRTDAAEFVFYARQVEQTKEPSRRFKLSPSDIFLLNPNTHTCPIFRTGRDAEIAKSIYRKVPILIRDAEPESNPWAVRPFLMFMMNTGSKIFRSSVSALSAPSTLLPLYEGKMIHQFDHRFGTYEGQTTAQANKGKLPEMTPEQKLVATLNSQPRYWVPVEEVRAKLGEYKAEWVLAFRDITNSVNERTTICAVLPLAAYGDTCPILLSSLPIEQQACLLGCLNSFVLDYSTRQTISGMHLRFSYLKQLPVLAPNVYEDRCTWTAGTNLIREWILWRVIELTYTSWDLNTFATDCGYGGPPFRWHEDRRFLLRCELDAAYFHLYSIERNDVDYILETFPIVKRKDTTRHGEYRTKRVILEIYDEMAAAMRTGVPYQTRLDPPPADPRVAHET